MERQATPGAMKLPPGAKDRERVLNLEAKVQALVSRVEALEKSLATSPAGSKPEGEPDKSALVARAQELGCGAPSQLTRWSVEKLQSAIAEKEQA